MIFDVPNSPVVSTPPVVANNVPIKSAWYAKINWTALGSAAATLLTTNAFGLDPQTQVTVLAVTNLITNVATVVFRTFFSNTVTAQQ